MRGKAAYYALGEAVAKALPKKIVTNFVRKLAALYAAHSPDLAAVMDNMRAALPPGTDERQVARSAREMIVNFSSLYLVNLFYSYQLSRPFIQRHVEIRGLETLDRELSKKRGVILASAHLGNWELGGMTLARLGYPLYAVALRHEDARIEGFFQKRRQACGLKIIPFGRSFKNCYSILKQNSILGLVGDRLFGEEGAQLPFMNKKLLFPRGIARISLFMKAPVLPTFFVSTGAYRYRLEIGAPLDGADEETIMRNFALRTEEKIRQYPTQWFIFQRFWETPEWPV